MGYNPRGYNQNNEDPEERKKRLEEEKKRQKGDIDAFRNRTNINNLDHMDGKVKDPTNNEFTNNKPVKAPEPRNGNHYQNPNGASNNNAIKPTDYGVPPKKIDGLNKSFTPFFEDENGEDKTFYSSHEIVLENSKWKQFHQSINGEFYDKDFPAETKSLVGVGSAKDNADKSKIEALQKYKFKRLSYVIDDIEVIRDGIAPTDIYQGQLGDCYFLSAIASIAERGKRLERNLLQRTKSDKGAYCVALNINGAWTPIVIDDIFPVREDGQLPFCYTKHKEIWAMALEKAYAKAYGAYWHIGNGGLSANALKDVTGAPCHYIDMREPEEEKIALKSVEEADGKDFIINCSSMGEGETKNKNGIISGHAYTLTGMKKLSNGVTLLHLRNPWGKGEWTGDWSDKSPLWNDSLKKEVQFSDTDDGSFYITYEDFKKNFDGIAICHYYDNFIYSYLPSRSKDESINPKQFTVTTAGEYYIGFSQPDKNMFSHDPNYNYGFYSCLIAKKVNGKIEYVNGFSNGIRDSWVKTKLEPGTYIALIYTNWNSANEDYTFWVYGPQNVVIKSVENQSNISKSTDIIQQALVHKAMTEEAEWTKFKNDKLSDARYKFSHCGNGYGYYIFDNKVAGLTLSATLIKSSVGCDYIYPLDAKGDECPLTIEANEVKLVVYRVKSLPNSVNFNVKFKMSLKSG